VYQDVATIDVEKTETIKYMIQVVGDVLCTVKIIFNEPVYYSTPVIWHHLGHQTTVKILFNLELGYIRLLVMLGIHSGIPLQKQHQYMLEY
jgi:hypothetical protein